MKREDQLFEELRKKELGRQHIFALSVAMKELADAISGHSIWDALRHTTQCIRYVNEFRGDAVPAQTLTEDQAELSAAFHTYMRKGMDCPLGTMLYRLISENRGVNIWYAFVKGVHNEQKNPKCTWKRAYYEAIQSAENVYSNSNDTDDLLMLSALKLWEDGFANAVSWVKGDDHEGEAGTC